MDARPLLEKLARALDEARLEAILIGNAAAALRGAPVTTVDFDFYFRKTPRNLQKLKTVAKALDVVLLRPSGLYRLTHKDDHLQADFMSVIHGFQSFAALRSASDPIDFAGSPILVASMEAIVKSKRAAGRPRDKAVLDILESTLHEEKETSQPAKAARGSQARKREKPGRDDSPKSS